MLICERCHQEIVDPTTAVRAREVIHEQEFGGEPVETEKGREVHFHPEHAPQEFGHYRLLDEPER